jgi:hypothetical protein
MPQCFAVYVEKELVGKRVKSSKVKVLWQIAFDEEFVVHQIELRHSIVSGKREVLFDNTPVYANKALFQGTFEHRSRLAGHDIRVTVEDTFEGYLYDLIVDNVMFHRMPRKTLADLEALRTDKKAVTVQTDFASFTGKSKSTLDGESAEKKKKEAKKEQPKEESLIELDWDAAVKVQAPRQATGVSGAQSQFNPFDSTFAAPPAAAQAYDPFGSAPQSYNGYAAPSAIPQQSFNQSYQAPTQQYYPPQSQQQAYDPFASFAQPPPMPQQYPPQPQYQQPPQQQHKQSQQQPYDPFGAF